MAAESLPTLVRSREGDCRAEERDCNCGCELLHVGSPVAGGFGCCRQSVGLISPVGEIDACRPAVVSPRSPTARRCHQLHDCRAEGDVSLHSMESVHRPLTWREIAVIFTFWTLLAVLSSANWLLDPRGPGFRPIDPSGPVSVAFIESWTWAALTPLIFRLSSRFSLARAPLLIVIGIVISIGVFLLLGFARQVVFAPLHHRPYRGLSELGRMRFVPQLL